LPRIRAEALLHQGLELFVAAQAWLQGIRFGIGVAAAARVAVVLAQRGCTAPLCSGAQPLAYALSPTYKAEGSGAALARFANARKAFAPSVQSTNRPVLWCEMDNNIGLWTTISLHRQQHRSTDNNIASWTTILGYGQHGQQGSPVKDLALAYMAPVVIGGHAGNARRLPLVRIAAAAHLIAGT